MPLKHVLAILVVCLCLGGCGNAQRGARTSEDALGVAELEVKTAPAPDHGPTKAAEAKVDADALIEMLADDCTTGVGVESQRRVIHYFESLYDAGNDAVPAIAGFLEQDLDKEFGRPIIEMYLNPPWWGEPQYRFGE